MVVDVIFGNLEAWLSAIGVWAYVIAPLIMAMVSILPMPAEAPAMANGMLFGPVVGSVITWTGAMAGAWISYELAKGWGRPLALRVANERAVARVDRAAESAGWWGLIVLRFIPVVAFTALNWGAGLCNVPRARFLWTTALGILPGVVLFTSSGVGLEVLWGRSPIFTVVLVALLVAGTVAWTVRRRRAEALG
jgi:uncharacterized membrane protein YdjX (TVP38/TMEM64 family)